METGKFFLSVAAARISTFRDCSSRDVVFFLLFFTKRRRERGRERERDIGAVSNIRIAYTALNIFMFLWNDHGNVVQRMRDCCWVTIFDICRVKGRGWGEGKDQEGEGQRSVRAQVAYKIISEIKYAITREWRRAARWLAINQWVNIVMNISLRTTAD